MTKQQQTKMLKDKKTIFQTKSNKQSLQKNYCQTHKKISSFLENENS